MSVALSEFEDISRSNHSLTSYFTAKPAGTNHPTTSHARNLEHGLDRVSKRSADDNNHSIESEHNRKRSSARGRATESLVDPLERSNGSVTQGSYVQNYAYPCPKCGVYFVDNKVLEHLDWHVALELQNS